MTLTFWPSMSFRTHRGTFRGRLMILAVSVFEIAWKSKHMWTNGGEYHIAPPLPPTAVVINTDDELSTALPVREPFLKLHGLTAFPLTVDIHFFSHKVETYLQTPNLNAYSSNQHDRQNQTKLSMLSLPCRRAASYLHNRRHDDSSSDPQLSDCSCSFSSHKLGNLCCSTSRRRPTPGSPCVRCSAPVCSVLPPILDSRWYGGRVHHSMNSRLHLCTQTFRVTGTNETATTLSFINGALKMICNDFLVVKVN